MRHKFLTLFIAVLFVLISVQLVKAVGIGAAGSLNTVTDFKPGLKETFSYFMVPNAQEIMDYELTTEGALSQYITLNPALLENVWPGQIPSFTATLQLPKEKLSPGLHSTTVCVAEAQVRGGAGAVGVKTKACAIIQVRSLYPEKYLEINGFITPNVNVGDILKFEILVKSWTESRIDSIKGTIEIFGPSEKGFGTKIMALNTGEKSLESNAEETLSAEIDTRSMESGEYLAKATVTYDGKTASASSRFRIGVLAVKIINYTRIFERGKVNKFEVEVESRWNRKIDKIYSEIFIENENESLKTPSISLNPWKEGTLLSYWEVPADKELKEYNAKIVVYHEANQTEGQANLQVVMSKEEIRRRNMTLAGLGGAAALLLISAVLIYFSRKRKAKIKNEAKKKKAKKIKYRKKRK